MPLRKIADVSNVVAGGTSTIRIPVGPTYDRIELQVGSTAGFNLNLFQNVRLMLNGKVLQEFTDLSVLDSINTYHGRVASSGAGSVATPAQIALHFRRPEVQAMGSGPDGRSAFSTTGAERLTSLRTGNLQTVTMEITCNAGLTAPFINAFSVEADGDPQPVGLLTKIRKLSYNAGASGDFEISDWPRGPRLIAAHFQKADANIITHKVNSYAVVDAVNKATMQRIQTEEARVPAAGFTVMDFCYNGDLDGALVTAGLRDMRSTVNLGTSGAFTVFLEMLDTIDGL